MSSAQLKRVRANIFRSVESDGCILVLQFAREVRLSRRLARLAFSGTIKLSSLSSAKKPKMGRPSVARP
jgi:hypothetical protein